MAERSWGRSEAMVHGSLKLLGMRLTGAIVFVGGHIRQKKSIYGGERIGSETVEAAHITLSMAPRRTRRHNVASTPVVP